MSRSVGSVIRGSRARWVAMSLLACLAMSGCMRGGWRADRESGSDASALVATDPGQIGKYTGSYRAKAEAGPVRYTTVSGEWVDTSRNGRVVPWMLYLPDASGGPAPLVVWSHGGGGTREGAAYLGEHLASHGFAALHIQHAGSDRDAFRADRRALFAGVQDPELGQDRYLDVKFVVRQIQAEAAGKWRGRIDPQRLGMSGHSYGAITTQIAAGQQVRGFGRAWAEPAFKGGFIMSPSPPRAGYDSGPGRFGDMLYPLFHLTGTADTSPADDFPVEQRRLPFDEINDVDQYLLIINEGTHMTFTGASRGFGPAAADPNIEANLPLIRAAAVAFWEATLKGDAEARKWLDQGGYAAFVGRLGRVEVKPAAKR